MVNDRQSVLLCIGPTMQQYQRLMPETTLSRHDRGFDPGLVLAASASINGGGGPPFSGAGLRRGRGVNSGLGLAAGNHRTRLTSHSPGPDFSFSAEYSGGC